MNKSKKEMTIPKVSLNARVEDNGQMLVVLSDLASFKSLLERVLLSYGIQNKRYQDGWKKDGLDLRATFAELNAKIFRLRTLVWKEFENLKVDEKQRAKVGETIVDAIVYLLFLWRRMEIEFGGIDEELLDKERDKS